MVLCIQLENMLFSLYFYAQHDNKKILYIQTFKYIKKKTKI